MTTSVDPTEFLRSEALNPSDIEDRYPNARRKLRGGLFISHSGRDYDLIKRDVVHPVVSDRFGDAYFLHNRGSGAAEEYRELVRTALHYIDKFLVVVSEASICNRWVRAEVTIAAELRRPIIQCLVDGANPSELHPVFGRRPWYTRIRSRVLIVDFRDGVQNGQFVLAKSLDQILKRYPYQPDLWHW